MLPKILQGGMGIVELEGRKEGTPFSLHALNITSKQTIYQIHQQILILTQFNYIFRSISVHKFTGRITSITGQCYIYFMATSTHPNSRVWIFTVTRQIMTNSFTTPRCVNKITQICVFLQLQLLPSLRGDALLCKY